MPNFPDQRPGRDIVQAPAEDILERLRREHEATLGDIDRLRTELDAQRALRGLRELRDRWVIHALAEETVVYRALEGGPHGGGVLADQRFVEHELVEGLFEKLARVKPGSQEWAARLNVTRDLIALHIEHEHDDLLARLARLPAEELAEIGSRFALACEKLALLESAKAA